MMPRPNVVAAAAAVHMNMQEVNAEDGRRYSLVGYVIESLNQAVTDADFEAALCMLSSVVAGGADVSAPCWVDDAGTEFYPPLEYVCVLHKLRLKLDAVAYIARSIAQAGGELHPNLLSSGILEHARNLLHPSSLSPLE